MGIEVKSMENSYVFTVSESSDWLVLHVNFGTSLATWGCYWLIDPLGRVRYQHMDVNSPRSIAIHRDPLRTCLNGVPGEIPAGEWRIDFTRKGNFKLHYEYGNGILALGYRPHIPDTYRDFWASGFDDSGCFTMKGYDWEAVREHGSRWYKGDCHLHSIQSDGCLTADQLNRQALEAGLDFIFVTDHNIFPTSWARNDRLLAIPGVEFTSTAGHCNALGTKCFIDFNPNGLDGGMKTESGMNRVIRDASNSGAVCSINHPFHKHFEWTFHDTALSLIDAIEIVNSPGAEHTSNANEEALVVWNSLWNEGYRIAGIGGSDFHFNEALVQGGEMSRVGNPTTWIFADRLAAQPLMDGIRNRRVCVTMGPEMIPSIQVDHQKYLPGDDLTEAIRTSPTGRVHWQLQIKGKGISGGQLHWIENGVVVHSETIVQSEDGLFEYAWQWKAEGWNWARAEVRNSEGCLIGFTNPVFCGHREPESRTWHEAVAKAGLTIPDLKQPGGAGW